MELIRYNKEVFTDSEGVEHFVFGEKPSWAWKHLGELTSDFYELYGIAWITYRMGCPYGVCEAHVVITYLSAVKGLSPEAAEYVANKVFEIRDGRKEDFQVWLEKQRE